jgi:pimeloyl-ACP methyl ester carboxylesterase
MYATIKGLFGREQADNKRTLATKSAPNDGWVKYSPSSSTVIVFVHGFLSDCIGCWTHEGGAFWPEIVSSDERFGDVSVFVAGYYTNINSLDYGIADCSSELLAALSVKQENGRASPIDFPNILFVCHSLGGIVARYMLGSHFQRFSSRSTGLVLMASPSLGSAYADVMSGLARLLGNRAGSQLRTTNELLLDLDRRFKGVLEDADGRIVGTEAVETDFYGHRVLTRLLPPVVAWESAARYFGHPERIGGTTHSSIVKPDSKNHPSHRLLLNFINGKFSKIRQENRRKTVRQDLDKPWEDKRPLVAKVLFEAYDDGCSDFYFARAVDEELSAALDVYAVWLYGPTGAGKTCLLKRYLCENGQKPIELSLSQLAGQLTKENCLAEIAETCCQLSDGGEIATSFAGITTYLTELARQSPVVFYFDEVPISSEREAEAAVFVQLLADLLISLKQRAGAGTRFVISSLDKPILAGNGKLNEQMVVFGISPWTKGELDGLYQLIVRKIPELSVEEEFLPTLLHGSRGSPRFLKTFLRNRFLANREISNGEVLERTLGQFDWR